MLLILVSTLIVHFVCVTWHSDWTMKCVKKKSLFRLKSPLLWCNIVHQDHECLSDGSALIMQSVRCGVSISRNSLLCVCVYVLCVCVCVCAGGRAGVWACVSCCNTVHCLRYVWYTWHSGCCPQSIHVANTSVEPVIFFWCMPFDDNTLFSCSHLLPLILTFCGAYKT
jgi:hypothetical protein